jgi:hypothetical protein
MTADPKPAPDIADQIADMMDAAGYGHLQAGLFYHPTTGVLLVECMGGPLDYNTFEVPLVDLLADAIKARLKTRGGDLPAPTATHLGSRFGPRSPGRTGGPRSAG